jgi:hypothetical protein
VQRRQSLGIGKSRLESFDDWRGSGRGAGDTNRAPGGDLPLLFPLHSHPNRRKCELWMWESFFSQSTVPDVILHVLIQSSNDRDCEIRLCILDSSLSAFLTCSDIDSVSKYIFPELSGLTKGLAPLLLRGTRNAIPA